MKAILQAFAAIGLVLIGVARFCARVGDEVVDVARRVDVPSGGAHHLDDMASANRAFGSAAELYPHLDNADELLKRYPGAKYKTPKTEDALEFLDYAGEVYEQFSPEEEEAFWEYAPTLSGFVRSQNWLNLQVYKHYRASKDSEELRTNFRHYLLADQLLSRLLELNTHKSDLPGEDLMLSALANEIQIRKEVVARATQLAEEIVWSSINCDNLYTLFREYFLMRYELQNLKRGDEILKQFDQTFFRIIPFLPLHESYARAKSTLLNGFNHFEHPNAPQLALGLLLHEEIDESKAQLLSSITGKEIAASPPYLKDWAYVNLIVDSLVVESIHGVDTFPKTEAGVQGLFGVKNVVYASNTPKGITDYFKLARYDNVWSEEKFTSTFLTTTP